MKSINRNLGAILEKWFFKGKVLVITGARQVGKTTLLQDITKRYKEKIWLNADLEADRVKLEKGNLRSLKNLLGNNKLIIIDEVQRVKNAGLILKILADNFKNVQVLATGSSALGISDSIFEPLTGRHLLFHLYPFALAELYKGQTSHQVEQELPFHLIYGNYPDICNNRIDAEVLIRNLTNQYLYKDVLTWKDIRKPDILESLLKLLAYQIGSEVSIHELANRLNIKSETVLNYIDLLEKSFVVFRLIAYSTNLRKEVNKMSKIYFFDNGVRNTLINNFDPLDLRNDVGALWENFMVSERQKHLTWQTKLIKPYFWRNFNQSEVDYLEAVNKKLFAYEMKWNPKSNAKVSRAFTNAYPEAATDIISPDNFYEFCGLE